MAETLIKARADGALVEQAKRAVPPTVAERGIAAVVRYALAVLAGSDTPETDALPPMGRPPGRPRAPQPDPR